jgi:hypothetical protein
MVGTFKLQQVQPVIALRVIHFNTCPSLSNMASTAQAARTETTSKQAVITSAQSLAVCRNLLKATVGQILYQRGLFNDSAFDSLKMANTTVKCLVRFAAQASK